MEVEQCMIETLFEIASIICEFIGDIRYNTWKVNKLKMYFPL